MVLADTRSVPTPLAHIALRNDRGSRLEIAHTGGRSETDDKVTVYLHDAFGRDIAYRIKFNDLWVLLKDAANSITVDRCQ